MNNTFYAPNDYRVYLEHHGIKGMKWGVRRFQNADGSYTSAGKGRYGIGDGQSYTGVKSVSRIGGKIKSAAGNAGRKISGVDLTPEQKAARNAKIKKAALAVAGTAAVAAGAYAASKYYKTTMAEARDHLRNSADKAGTEYILFTMKKDAALDHLKDEAGRAYDSGRKRAFFNKNAAADILRKSGEKSTIDRFGEFTRIANDDKQLQRTAQKAVIKRDLESVKDSFTARRAGLNKSQRAQVIKDLREKRTADAARAIDRAYRNTAGKPVSVREQEAYNRAVRLLSNEAKRRLK